MQAMVTLRPEVVDCGMPRGKFQDLPFQRETIVALELIPNLSFSAFKYKDLGKKKDSHQKFVMPKMTELISCSLPAKERVRAAHEENLDLTLAIRGAQLAAVSFRDVKGTPKYLTGNSP